jgi:enoyl-CoA hydratase
MSTPDSTDAAFEYLRFERDGDVLVVTIDKPDDPLNKVDDRLHHELTALFPRLQAERYARAVLLTGTGSSFSAGGDFDWFPQLREPGRLEDLRLDARRMIDDLLDVHLPIVCAITGHAMGLGASIALLCDVVVMAETARLGDPHVRVGLVAGDGGTIAWPLALGPMLAKRYLLTGDALTAADAERLGLVAETTPDAESCRAAGLAWAQRLAAGPPLAVQYTKQAINAWMKQTSWSAFEQASALEIVTFGSDDHAEALAALAEKRDPRFTGR